MKKTESKGFFCVVYLSEEKKTTWYNRVWMPSKLVEYLNKENKSWLWIKIYINKNDYFSNTKASNYHAIFDKDHPVHNFTFRQFANKIG
jgi:hypothetical protein